MDRDGYSIWIFQQNVIIVAIYSCLFFFVVFFCYVSLKNRSWMEFSGKRVLLVIAHPDDECMFFGPVIYHACRAASSFSLLCLTKGLYCLSFQSYFLDDTPTCMAMSKGQILYLLYRDILLSIVYRQLLQKR